MPGVIDEEDNDGDFNFNKQGINAAQAAKQRHHQNRLHDDVVEAIKRPVELFY